MSKIGMIGFVSNLSTRDSSHNGGYTTVCKMYLEEVSLSDVHTLDNRCNIHEYDTLVLNEGVNFREGKFNFFGGVQERQLNGLIEFSKYKGNVYSINEEVDYNYLTENRREFKELGLSFPKPIKIIKTDRILDKLIIGDSHSLSVYKKGFAISRNDGKTLNGFLKNGIKNYILESINELVFYAGNIDVRFHLCRLEPDISKMVEELKRQLLDLKIEKISVVQLLPLENESRKIPKTGLYKGEPFFGTLDERKSKRNELNNLLEEMCLECGFEFLKWDLGDSLSFDDMEARQSVHLRPSSYMFLSDKQRKLF